MSLLSGLLTPLTDAMFLRGARLCTTLCLSCPHSPCAGHVCSSQVLSKYAPFPGPSVTIPSKLPVTSAMQCRCPLFPDPHCFPGLAAVPALLQDLLPVTCLSLIHPPDCEQRPVLPSILYAAVSNLSCKNRERVLLKTSYGSIRYKTHEGRDSQTAAASTKYNQKTRVIHGLHLWAAPNLLGTTNLGPQNYHLSPSPSRTFS